MATTTTFSRWSLREVLARRKKRKEQQRSQPGQVKLLYESVASGSKSRIKVSGVPVVLKAPKVVTINQDGSIVEASGNLHDHGPPPGFVLGGDIKLFGLNVPAKLYSFQGEVAVAVQEMVVVGEEMMLKQLLKGFGRGLFDEVVLKHTVLTYQAEEDAVTRRPPGLHFETEISFGGALETLRETLARIFGVTEPSLKVAGHMGNDREWNKPLSTSDFVVKGSFAGIECKIGEMMTFKSVGVQLVATRGQKRFLKHTLYECGFSFFGAADLVIPGSVVPLTLDYSLKEETVGSHTLRLTKAGGEWVNAMGFKGLRLSGVQLVAVIPTNEALGDLSFEAEASLPFAQGTLTLRGVFAAGEFYFEADIPDCSMNDILKLYNYMTGRELEDFKHDVQFKSLMFRADVSGVFFSGEVTIDGHRSVQAKIDINRDGIEITGGMQKIMLGQVTIEAAQLEVFIGRTSPGTTSRQSGFAITGSVTFHEIEVSVALYTVFEENQPVMWTVYGELDLDLQLSHLTHSVKGTFLDLSLRQVAFIASNHDSPSGNFNVFNYPVRKGIQLCAAIDRMEQLDHITGGRVEGLVFRASYSDDRLTFGILFPAPLSLGPNLTSGPLSLEVVATGMPQLIFTTSLNVKMANQTQPLVFTLGLKADMDSAEGFGTMTNYWVNPLGIGENVKIGPELALELGIVYTGSPRFGFSGGLAIGEVETQVAVLLSENPAEQLIKASFTRLSISDLIGFASKLVGGRIPLPPEDLFTIKNGLFYISTGATIGGAYYPPGVSITADFEIFGEEANFECSIGRTVRIKALLDDLQLGPLTVSGALGERPCTIIELGLEKQQILIDGRVKLFALEAAIHAELNIMPVPSMVFVIRLAFADALEFELGAKAIGATDFKSLKDMDFQIHVVLEQHIMAYITAQAQAHFKAIGKVLKDGIEAAEALFNELKEQLDAQLQEAEEAFEAAKDLWEQKEREIKEAFDEAVAGFEEGLAELGRDLARAEKNFEDALSYARQRLEQARIDRAAAITNALTKVRKAKRELQADIMRQLFDIRETKKGTARGYGAILQDVKFAEKKHKKAQGKVGKYERELAEAQKELEEAPFYRHIDLHIKVCHYKEHVEEAQADLLSAKRILENAQRALENTGYQAAVAEKTAKKEILMQIKEQGEQVMKSTEEGLEEKVKVFDEIVVASKVEIDEHEEPSTGEKKVLVEAKQVLQQFKETKKEEIASLESKLQALPQTSEYAELEQAKERLLAAKIDHAQLDAAKEAMKLAQEEAVAGASLASSVLGNLDQIFDINRIELSGSLRDLIENGRPLTARIQGVIAGNPIDLVIDYELGKTQDFVKALLSKWWEEAKANLVDIFDGDNDEEGKEQKEKVVAVDD